MFRQLYKEFLKGLNPSLFFKHGLGLEKKNFYFFPKSEFKIEELIYSYSVRVKIKHVFFLLNSFLLRAFLSNSIYHPKFKVLFDFSKKLDSVTPFLTFTLLLNVSIKNVNLT